MKDLFKWFIWIFLFIFAMWFLFSIFNSNNKNNYNSNYNYSNNILNKEEDREVLIFTPTFMDEKCQIKYPWTKYNKYNDKCECPKWKDFDENINSCPVSYENIVWKNLSFDYSDDSWFALPANAHCVPNNINKAWECDYWYYQSRWQWGFSWQIVCINRKTYEYYWLITCEKEYSVIKTDSWEYKSIFKCKPNTERPLKNNYEKN